MKYNSQIKIFFQSDFKNFKCKKTLYLIWIGIKS